MLICIQVDYLLYVFNWAIVSSAYLENRRTQLFKKYSRGFFPILKCILPDICFLKCKKAAYDGHWAHFIRQL